MSLEIIDNDISMCLETFGQGLQYYSGRICTCVSENNGLPKPDCGCNLGFWYDESPEAIVGIRTSVDYKYLNTPQGRIYDGGAKFTIPKFVDAKEQLAYKKLAHGDIIVVDNKTRRDTDILRKGIRDKLFAFDVQEIISVSQKSKVYKQGIDFDFNGTTIVWLDSEEAEQPNEGDYYAVEFICKQQYKVWEVGAKDRGTQEDNLPRYVMCVLRRYVEQETPNPLDKIQFDQQIF